MLYVYRLIITNKDFCQFCNITLHRSRGASFFFIFLLGKWAWFLEILTNVSLNSNSSRIKCTVFIHLTSHERVKLYFQMYFLTDKYWTNIIFK